MQKWIGFAVVSFSFLVTIMSLTGCSSGSNPHGQPATGLVTISGRVMGGQQPVSGSVIQLWAVGASGYGSAPTGLISAGNQAISGIALTDANGFFNITGTYTCPTPGSTLVYLTSTGGNPGLGAGTNNSAISLLNVLGPCSSLSGSTVISINEASTVVGAYALAQFMDPTTGNIGYYSASSIGINNAFSLPSTMFSNITGVLSTTPGAGGVVPQQEINTLANILASCVNTSGPSSATCQTLFTDTTIGASAPSNTLTAILSIALHPGNNVSDLFSNLAGGFPPFTPALSSAPNDFTIALSYNSGATTPTGLAIDTSGALWIPDYVTGGATSRWVRRTVTAGPGFGGSPYSTTGTTGLHGVGIDANGSVWGISQDNNTVSKFLVSGAVQNGPYSTGNSPRAIAFDTANNAWVTNSTDNSISVMGSLGAAVATATGGGLSAPRDIAIDTNGFAWVANHSSAAISSFSLSGSTATSRAGTTGFTGGGLGTPKAVAVDSSNNIWIGSNASSTVISEFNNAGTPVSSSGYSDNTNSSTAAIAFDGNGNLWSANQGNVLTELGPTGTVITPSTGYQAAALAGVPNAIAVDGSGNVWVTTASPTTVNSVSANLVQFVGAAAPVITPLALALKKGQVNQRPGTPTPIVITTNTFPYFTPGTAYQARVLATGGNTGSYTFTLASGALPSGMTLATNGGISGTSNDTTAATFTVQATDSTFAYNYITKTLTLSPSNTLPAGTNNSELAGQYAVQISGLKGGTTSNSGNVTGFGALGNITFDGSGNLSGTFDYNGATSATSQQYTVTGTYSIGSDNRGVLLMNASTTGFLPTELTVSLGNFNSGVAQTMRVEEFDWTGIGSGTHGIADGVGKLQTTAAFTPGTIGQTFVFGADGESPCSTCSGTVSPYGSISAAGRFVNSSGVSTGQEDAAAINNSYSGVTLAGTYTAPDPTTGRGTIILIPTGTLFPAAPTNYIYYVVNSGELLLLSADGHTTTSLLIGDALVQSGSFSNATVAGNYIGYEAAATNGDGASNFPNQMNLNMIAFTFTGTGSFTALAENSNQGTITLENNLGGGSLPYSIDTNGRMTIAGGSANTPVFYLANSSGGFGTDTPNSGHTPGMFIVEQQAGSGFSCSSLSGSFFFGTNRTVTEAATTTGVTTFSGSSGSGTADNSDPSGLLTYGSATTLSCSTDSYTSSLGRLKFTSNSNKPSVAYIISPTKAVIMDVTPGKTTPSITILQK